MKYEKRVVLFLDVLGFQRIIDETVDKGTDEDEQSQIKKLYDTLVLMKQLVTKLNPQSSKQVTQFSDTIIISFKENDRNEVKSFFPTILQLIVLLTSRDILCRGAISYGKLFHDSDFVFGPALIDAYLTESTAALYPRVVIDRSIIEILKTHYHSDNLSQIRFDTTIAGALHLDGDDKLYFDYFAGAMAVFQEPELLKYYETLRGIIVEGNKTAKPSIKIKYGWMKKWRLSSREFRF